MARKNEMMNEEETTSLGETEGGNDEEKGDASVAPTAPDQAGDASPQAPGGEEGAGMEGEAESEERSDPESFLKAEVEILQGDLSRLQDQHLRLAADFENYRKRVTAELASGWVRGQAELARALLEGLDDLQRVSRFTSEDATLEALIEGVDLVERKLLKALTDAGLTAVDPTGEPFDPNTMEAMMRVPTDDEEQDETVHQVFQKGYLFKDQLVRPARVSVYKDDD